MQVVPSMAAQAHNGSLDSQPCMKNIWSLPNRVSAYCGRIVCSISQPCAARSAKKNHQVKRTLHPMINTSSSDSTMLQLHPMSGFEIPVINVLCLRGDKILEKDNLSEDPVMCLTFKKTSQTGNPKYTWTKHCHDSNKKNMRKKRIINQGI